MKDTVLEAVSECDFISRAEEIRKQKGCSTLHALDLANKEMRKAMEAKRCPLCRKLLRGMGVWHRNQVVHFECSAAAQLPPRVKKGNKQ